VEVAKDLLGKYLVRRFSEGNAVVKIVETEAYLGIQDPASHSYGGKITSRNRVMYRNGGVFYVYKIYGIYYCLNVVANIEGIPEAVFIRSAEPISGIEIMRKKRETKEVRNLCNGPGRLTQALGIDLSFYGRRVTSGELYFLPGEKIEKDNIISAPRINIDYAGEAKNLPLRFYIKDNKFVSKK
jgi:DNA-3-methyladenine glycosylase